MVFLGDHGVTYGEYASTPSGALEHINPRTFLLSPKWTIVLMVSLPEWFEKEHSFISYNLKKNQEKLVTPYDVFLTLKDIVTYPGTTSILWFNHFSDISRRSSSGAISHENDEFVWWLWW